MRQIALVLLLGTAALAQDDVEYGKRIRAHTTEPAFLTEWVDHLPVSKDVPSPLAHLGYSIGTPDVLTPGERINGYFRALAKASDRMRVFAMGRSHQGREMIVAAIADKEVLDRLDDIVAANRSLADPRRTDEAAARRLAGSTPPIYWISAGLHSPETGPPEMVMELAYRLIASERRHIREIRKNVVTLISPVLEMDGRARMVDWYYRVLKGHADHRNMPPFMAPYWGDYTAHDNNRDGLQQSQPLTRNYTDTYFRFLPVLSLDLHESVPLLYVSGGTGPYNPTIDPITVTEWQWIAGYEVSECTRLGLRGVWTWGFYTGWYPGYLLWVTNNHNAIGRFYETFGNLSAGTFDRDLRSASYSGHRLNTPQWYRPWPPGQKVRWSLRNNTNYMQTGVLASLRLAARNGETLLFNYWRKGANAVRRGRERTPHAIAIPAQQRDRGSLFHLRWLLKRHRVEFSVAAAAGAGVAKGDYLVRLDQPYGNLARTLLVKGMFPKSAEQTPYDDVAWSLDYMLGVELKTIDDPKVFDVPVTADADPPAAASGAGPVWIVAHHAQTSLATFVWSLGGARMSALRQAWKEYPAGSVVIEGATPEDVARAARAAHLEAESLAAAPDGESVPIDLPRVALFHTWSYTRDSGWARYTLEQLKIPFTLISKDQLRAGGLRDRFDVILMPSQSGMPFSRIVHGIDPKWGPIAYTKTERFPGHGRIDASSDITGGMGFSGLANLQEFVRDGGVFVTLGSAGVLPADGGMARPVRTVRPPALHNPGSHVTAKVLRPEHPVTWGYPRLTHVFRGNLPLFSVAEKDRGLVLMQYGTKTRREEEIEQDKKADLPVAEPESQEETEEKAEKEKKQEKQPLVLSGMVKGADALQRKAAILDVPVGKGRIVMFSWNPMHRYQNHHDFSFVTNALLFWNDYPATPTGKEMRSREEE